MRRFFVILAIAVTGTIPSSLVAGERGSSVASTPIEHFVVVMQQNHTFDNYFGTYPGADGIPVGSCMPADLEAPDAGCVEPYRIGESRIEDLRHSRAIFEGQYNGGRMDGFVAALDEVNQTGSIAMGYYDGDDLPYYWNLADEYVLFDRFFSSARAGSIWNRMFWVAGVPGSERPQIPRGGYEVDTIFDRLQAAGVSWKFYVNNYDPELTYRSLEDLAVLPPQIPWVPLVNFPRFLDDPALASKIVPLDEYYSDLENGTLPAVSYVVALGATEHPLTSLTAGQRMVGTMVHALMQSDAWERSAFLITYDDWGGWYDHVPPPQVDDYGLGFRVPAMLVSPYAPKGKVDSTEYEFTSILRFIEENYGLDALGERRSPSLLQAFDFLQSPRKAQLIPYERDGEGSRAEPNRAVLFGAYASALALSTFLVMIALRMEARPPRRVRSGTREGSEP